MPTIQQAINQGREQLAELTDNPQSEALFLLEYSTNKTKEFLIVHADEALESTTHANYLSLLKRRQAGEPLAYITQIKEFWSLPVAVEPGVLIPRPDTELLIEVTLTLAKHNQALKILDLGTGSGCIALALAKEFPQAEIIACDNSHTCLSVANRNAEKLNLNNISFTLSDWFEDIIDTDFDIIVSNPPYISNRDPYIDSGVKKFEPASALFAENDGYAALALIISQAANYLVPGGVLLVEHGFQQAHDVRTLFTEYQFEDITTHRDLYHHERVTLGHIA